MASDDLRAFVEAVGGWEGFEIAQWTTEEALEPDAFGLPAKRIVIELEPAADAVKRCSRCGNPVAAIHDVTERRVRDLPLMGFDRLAGLSARAAPVPPLRPDERAAPVARSLSADDQAVGGDDRAARPTLLRSAMSRRSFTSAGTRSSRSMPGRSRRGSDRSRRAICRVSGRLRSTSLRSTKGSATRRSSSTSTPSASCGWRAGARRTPSTDSSRPWARQAARGSRPSCSISRFRL